ncbi:f-box only protein [Anaeramoeba flamelloides]|uniref:F-box only protein n=1 Tax=Anaeramoeba flamelloides TaxID=1746091 RepID=A0ABQ8XNW8_9EUKA|nr:f-box only protein [Anaeramoeba flamelloides]
MEQNVVFEHTKFEKLCFTNKRAKEHSLMLLTKKKTKKKSYKKIVKINTTEIQRRNTTNTNPFSILPDEMILKIFSFLKPPHLTVCSCVDRRFECITQDYSLWENFYERNYRTFDFKGLEITKFLKKNLLIKTEELGLSMVFKNLISEKKYYLKKLEMLLLKPECSELDQREMKKITNKGIKLINKIHKLQKQLLLDSDQTTSQDSIKVLESKKQEKGKGKEQEHIQEQLHKQEQKQKQVQEQEQGKGEEYQKEKINIFTKIKNYLDNSRKKSQQKKIEKLKKHLKESPRTFFCDQRNKYLTKIKLIEHLQKLEKKEFITEEQINLINNNNLCYKKKEF